MESSTISPRPNRTRWLRLSISSIAVCLIAITALAVPHVIHSAHAASPTHATSSCAQPPAGKDLSAMSPQQLQGYGIPSTITKQARWKTIAPHLKHRFCFPAHAPAPAVQHGIMQPQQFDEFDCSFLCVAGMEGDTPSTFPVTFAHASWGVPCAFFRGGNTTLATWVGVGGLDSNTPMLRVGVIQLENVFTINTPGGPVTEHQDITYAYFQDTADPSTAGIQPGFGVNCGDQMEAYVYLPSGELWAIDDNTNTYFDVFVNPNVDRTNVACNVEDPNDGAQPIPDFGIDTGTSDTTTITFSDCEASNNGRGGTGLLDFPSSVQRSMGYFPIDAYVWPVNGAYPDGSTFSVFDYDPEE